MSAEANSSVQSLLKVLRGVFTQVAEPREVLGMILQQAVKQTGATRGVFVEVTEGKLTYRVLHEFDRRDVAAHAGRFSRSVFSRVLDSGEPLVLADAMADERFDSSESIRDMEMVSVICMPIRADGQIRALVHLERDRQNYFNSQHRTLLQSLLDVAGSVLEALRAGHQVIREREILRITAKRYRQEIHETREILSRDWSFGRFLGRSEPIRALDAEVSKAAETDFPVLVLGETGTGKSLLARILHSSSKRANQTLVTVFCPALEKSMVESELFGHRRGAFTGAEADRIGKVQSADKGTLFFDEVGELPLEIQPKLLRLLQEKSYERLGDPREHTADVRVIAATNRDLRADVELGRFRRDLFERLNFIPVRIPPLRERRDDIPLLMRHALDRYESGRWIEVDDEAMAFLARSDYGWPGNVREVEQLAARLAMDGLERPVTPDDLERRLGLPPGSAGMIVSGTGDVENGAEGLEAFLERAERGFLERMMKRHPDLTRRQLAARLKIGERTLFKKLSSHRLT